MNPIENLEPVVDGAVDIPAVTDYIYNEVIVWDDSDIDLPSEVLHHLTPYYNQWVNGRDPSTIYACTRYWVVHWVNENNAYEWSWIAVDPITEWIIALKDYGANENAGDSLRSALEQARDRWQIEWYARVVTKFDIQHALVKWYCIYTGTSYCDWTKTRASGIFEPKPAGSYWHAFVIHWYNDKWVIARNSYGKAYTYDGIEWSFLIKWADVKWLFSMYALIDKQDVDKIKLEKIKQDEASKKRMMDLGIWNGQNEDAPVTRGEAILMMDRVRQNIIASKL